MLSNAYCKFVILKFYKRNINKKQLTNINTLYKNNYCM